MHTRRGFLDGASTACRAAVALLVAIPGIRFLLDPIRAAVSHAKEPSNFRPIAKFDDLRPGQPLRVTISGERRDAFLRYPSVPLGAVWLIRDGRSESSVQVRCLQTICPHLGCSILFAEQRQVFECPCHASAFRLDGSVQDGPAPRSMDAIDCRVAASPNGEKLIEIRYQQFQTGTSERIPIA